jgi:hypothetical protein
LAALLRPLKQTSTSALVFRGWGREADDVVDALTGADIRPELVDTLVPGIMGGFEVREVFVRPMDLAAARRIILIGSESRT